jgi:Tat protein translocase TatC
MKRSPTGEMPFLDHLEELRLRILRSLVAVVAGFAVGLLLVQRFDLVVRLKAPIAPYLPEGQLTVLGPTDPVMIVLKLSAIVGLVLASPVLLWQAWAFLAPALYEREKRALVPALFVGLALFLLGSAFGWFIVVPKALAVLLSFQPDAFNTMITYDRYFGFVIQVVLALGLSSELPLLLMLLTAIGVVTPRQLGRFRRHALVLALVAGALLSPGGDVFTMALMTVPLVLLYELGLAGSVVLHRRRLRLGAAAAVLIASCVVPLGAQAQEPLPPLPRLPGQADTTRPVRRDTASARRLGLPVAPSRPLPAPDSVERQLLERAGFVATRYQADTAVLSATDRLVRLTGSASTERQGTVLEAQSISYQELACDLVASGDPRLFDRGSVLIGETLRYDTCIERGVVRAAFTSFDDAGTNWFLRGNLGVDSSAARRFAASSEITSCDLPVPHYHFAAKEVKWMSASLMVARPAVLYIRDVPVAWIPFLFQETRTGRRSGILVPQFGFNDLVRPDRSYQRQITNFGYYWAGSQYFDLAVRFDWYARRHTTINAVSQYKWLNRFLEGSVDYSRQTENTGARTETLRWTHRQQMGLTTSFTANVNLTSNSRVLTRNAIDPILTTQQLTSNINLQRRFAWGQMALGGNRSQTLGDDQVTQTLPSLSITPKPLDLGRVFTWSPALNLTNTTATEAKTFVVIPRPAGGVGGGGGVDSIEQTPRRRTTDLSLQTPLRIGRFDLRLDLRMQDRQQERAVVVTERVPDPHGHDPADSLTVTRLLAGTYQTDLDWNTGFSLPILFARTWKLVPSIGIANATGGPYAVRNERTDGRWITQGKRLQYSVSIAPTLYAFFGGLGPVARIRHSVSPGLSWSYSPEARIPEDYARAVAADPNAPLTLVSPPRQTLTFTVSQNFEAKERTPDDTLAARQGRKVRLLSIQTSAITYDLEQAKQPGRTGWTTQTVSNSILSDLVPGLNLSLTHDLWEGVAGTDTARFAPFLQSVSAGFGVSGNTVRALGALLGLGAPPQADAPSPGGGTQGGRAGGPELPGSWLGDQRAGLQQRTLRQTNMLTGARRGFTANFNISISRQRPVQGSQSRPGSSSSIAFSTSFSPSSFWGVSWQTMYNVTSSRFESHTVRLERDLHDWRAGFNLIRNVNGNFAFYFSVHLVDLPDLRVDYNQTTIRR